jgi:hypothetical protein
MDDVADVSELRATFTIRVEAYKLLSCCFESSRTHRGKSAAYLTAEVQVLSRGSVVGMATGYGLDD